MMEKVGSRGVSSLCSLPKSSAFELGVAAIAFLTVAQLVGTTAAATTMCAFSSKTNKSTSPLLPPEAASRPSHPSSSHGTYKHNMTMAGGR